MIRTGSFRGPQAREPFSAWSGSPSRLSVDPPPPPLTSTAEHNKWVEDNKKLNLELNFICWNQLNRIHILTWQSIEYISSGCYETVTHFHSILVILHQLALFLVCVGSLFGFHNCDHFSHSSFLWVEIKWIYIEFFISWLDSCSIRKKDSMIHMAIGEDMTKVLHRSAKLTLSFPFMAPMLNFLTSCFTSSM